MNRGDRRQLRREGLVCEHGHVKKTDGTGTPMCPHWCGFEHLRPRWPSLATVLGQHPDITHHSYANPRMFGDPACGCGWQDLTGPSWSDHFNAVWRELRTIATAEQLATLPIGSSIRELDHPVPGVFELQELDETDDVTTAWYVVGDGWPTEPRLPALLLEHPDWATS